MRHHPVKLILYAGLVTILLLVAGIVGTVVWVSNGPHQADFLSPAIEEAMTRRGAGYSVKIKHTYISSAGLSHPIAIRVKGVDVFSKDGSPFASFPEVTLRFNPVSLLGGSLGIQTLSLKKPEISLFQTPDGKIHFGLAPEGEQKASPLPKILSGLFSGSSSANIENIVIEDANLSIGNAEGIFFRAPHSQIAISRKDKGLRGIIDVKAEYEGSKSFFSGELSIPDDDNHIIFSLDFRNTPLGLVSKLLPSDIIDRMDFFASGWVDGSVSSEGVLDMVDFEVATGPGSFAYQPELPEVLALDSIDVSGFGADDLNYIKLDKAKAVLGETQAEASAVISKVDGKWAVNGTAHGRNMPVSDLHKYWPVSLAPSTREWVVKQITAGYVPEAEVALDFKPGELDLPAMPEEALDATVQLRDATVNYLEGYPIASNINGAVKFTGKVMDIDLTSGTMLTGTTISKGKVFVPDLNLPDTQMQIALDVQAPASDIITFIDHKDINAAKSLGLNPQTIKGTIAGNLKLDFLAFTTTPQPAPKPGDTWDGVNYDIKANLQQVSQPKFLGNMDITGLDGVLTLNNKTLTFEGKGKSNGVPATLNLTHAMTGKAKLQTEYTVTATAQASDLAKFGFPKLDFVKGPLDVVAKVKEGKKSQESDVTINLKNASVDYDTLNWKKTAGTPATLKFLAIENEGAPLELPSFSIEGADIKLAGKATVDADYKGMQSVSFQQFEFGRNKLTQLDYAAIPGGHKVAATGETFDLSGFMDDSDSSMSLKNFPALDMKLDVNNLYFTPEKDSLRNVKGFILCDETRCTGADLVGSTQADTHFAFAINNDSGARMVKLTADNAGDFLRTIDIFPNMSNGKLIITGKFDDSVAPSVLNGRLLITDYSLTKAPVLTKILTLASITGIFEALGGKGIGFKKMASTFSIKDDVITLADGKTHGPSLGLTAKGTIDIAKSEADITGTVVPSYTLNTLLDKVPIIGPMLTGGKGGGVFAANYTMKGPLKDPTVNVNPLSILTPGFLRNIFDMGEGGDAAAADETPPARLSPAQVKKNIK